MRSGRIFTRDQVDEAKEIDETFVGESRWSNRYRVVIEVDGKNWIGVLSYPKTEYQEGDSGYTEYQFFPAVQRKEVVLVWKEE